MLDDTEQQTEIAIDAEALKRLRGSLRQRQSSLRNEAHDLLDDHITAMRSLHPELNDAIDVLMDILLGCEFGHETLRPTLRVLGVAAPGALGRVAALYDLSLLLDAAEVGRLRLRGLTSLEIDLGLRERWMETVKERLAANFAGAAQQAVREAAMEREERQR